MYQTLFACKLGEWWLNFTQTGVCPTCNAVTNEQVFVPPVMQYKATGVCPTCNAVESTVHHILLLC